MPAGVILAGGTSSRFGEDKANVELAGRRLLDMIVDAHREAGCDPIVVAKRSQRSVAVPEGCMTATDPEGAEGPRAGLLAGMRKVRASGEGWAWLSPVDVPMLDPALLSVLIDATAGIGAAAPVSEEGMEPQLALLPVEPALAILEGSDGWKGSVRSLLADLDATEVGEAEWQRAGLDASCFWNANRPADLARIEEWLRARR